MACDRWLSRDWGRSLAVTVRGAAIVLEVRASDNHFRIKITQGAETVSRKDSQHLARRWAATENFFRGGIGHEHVRVYTGAPTLGWCFSHGRRRIGNDGFERLRSPLPLQQLQHMQSSGVVQHVQHLRRERQCAAVDLLNLPDLPDGQQQL